MKTNFFFKRMMLLGFMFMAVSINVFANNANEEENIINVTIEKSISLSANEVQGQPVTLGLSQDTGWRLLPTRSGYECTGYEVVWEGSHCVDVELSEGSRNTDSVVPIYRFVRYIARALGRAALKLRYTPVDSDGNGNGNGNTIIISIQITIVR